MIYGFFWMVVILQWIVLKTLEANKQGTEKCQSCKMQGGRPRYSFFFFFSRAKILALGQDILKVIQLPEQAAAENRSQSSTMLEPNSS